LVFSRTRWPKLQRRHAAHGRAVGIGLGVAAADAVNDGDRLRLGLAIAEHDLAVGGAGGVAKPLEFQVRIHVRQLP